MSFQDMSFQDMSFQDMSFQDMSFQDISFQGFIETSLADDDTTVVHPQPPYATFEISTACGNGVSTGFPEQFGGSAFLNDNGKKPAISGSLFEPLNFDTLNPGLDTGCPSPILSSTTTPFYSASEASEFSAISDVSAVSEASCATFSFVSTLNSSPTSKYVSTTSRPNWLEFAKPKVRSGCFACKRRRVKCDERRPSCTKCKKSGRLCDGYPSLQSREPTPSLYPKVPKIGTVFNTSGQNSERADVAPYVLPYKTSNEPKPSEDSLNLLGCSNVEMNSTLQGYPLHHSAVQQTNTLPPYKCQFCKVHFRYTKDRHRHQLAYHGVGSSTENPFQDYKQQVNDELKPLEALGGLLPQPKTFSEIPTLNSGPQNASRYGIANHANGESSDKKASNGALFDFFRDFTLPYLPPISILQADNSSTRNGDQTPNDNHSNPSSPRVTKPLTTTTYGENLSVLDTLERYRSALVWDYHGQPHFARVIFDSDSTPNFVSMELALRLGFLLLPLPSAEYGAYNAPNNQYDLAQYYIKFDIAMTWLYFPRNTQLFFVIETDRIDILLGGRFITEYMIIEKLNARAQINSTPISTPRETPNLKQLLNVPQRQDTSYSGTTGSVGSVGKGVYEPKDINLHTRVNDDAPKAERKIEVKTAKLPQMPRGEVRNNFISPQSPSLGSSSPPKSSVLGKASPYIHQSQDGESDSFFESENDASDDDCEAICSPTQDPSIDSFNGPKQKLFVDILGIFWDTYNQEVSSIISYCIAQLASVENAKQNSGNIDRSTSHASVSASLLPPSSASPSRKRISEDKEFPKDDGGKGSKDPNEERSRPLIDTLPFKYACPFRKHNPRKYNVHHFQQCALGCFGSISRLKEHLYRRHMAQIQCVRCWLFFKDQEDLNIHMMANNICERRNGQLAEGVTPSIERKLRKRTRLSGNQKDEDRWRDIYRMLFPGEEVPSPFYEPVQDEAAPNFETPDISIEEFLRQEVPDIFTDRLQIEVNNMDLQETGLLDNPAQLRQNFVARLDNLIREAQDAAIQSYRQRASENASQNNQMPTPAPSSSSGSLPTPMPEPCYTKNTGSLDSAVMPVYDAAIRSLSSCSESRQDISLLPSGIKAAADEDYQLRPGKRARYEPHLSRQNTQSEEFELQNDQQQENFKFGDFDISQADLGNDIDFANFDFSTWNSGTIEHQESTN